MSSSSSHIICLLIAMAVLMSVNAKECSGCQEDAPVDLGLVLPPELYESTRLANLLARPSSQFKNVCVMIKSN
uniref:Secreted protein n=1 Tax=Caenorhabditis tropicalis TaxID=1561998 RepID=A0A1I7UHI6_9PELO